VKKAICIILSIIIPILSYYYIKSLNINFESVINIENVVGIVAILSGVSGIIIGTASVRQANLIAVKEYFEQGDNSEHISARKYIADNKNKIYESKIEVSQIINFFQMWGLLNRKKYLPIWVFSGASRIRVVELYINLENIKRILKNQT